MRFRAGKDPVLFVNNPKGLSSYDRRKMLSYLSKLHGTQHAKTMDHEKLIFKDQGRRLRLTDVQGNLH